MNAVELVGFAAAVLTTVAFVPQAWKIWRTRDSSGISLSNYLLFTSGVALWLLYGALAAAWPVIVANGITLVLAVFILIMKLRLG